MTHQMNLNPQPFEMIESGQKTIELRLYDERRQSIQPGDTIVFTHTEDPDRKMTVIVQKLHIFDSFGELYQNLPLLQCGYTPEDAAQAHPSDMDVYYPVEKQQQYRVVGIEIVIMR